MVGTQPNHFGFVQIRRHLIKTHLNQNYVLEIVDISDKIMYQMAKGEQTLLSLINATVSHEMRNPINSIHVQVVEMCSLNDQLSEMIDSLTPISLKKQKNRLK